MTNQIILTEYLRNFQIQIEQNNVGLAENLSLYSDSIAFWIKPGVLSRANNCIAAILVIATTGFNALQENNLKNQIVKVLNRRNSEDERWIFVRDLLLTKPFTPGVLVDKVLRHQSPETFFGNTLKGCGLILKNLRYELIDQPRRYRSHPKRVNTCEYKDKGSRRPKHVSVKMIPRSSKNFELEEFELSSDQGSILWYSQLPMKRKPAASYREISSFQEEKERKEREDRREQRKGIRRNLKSILRQIRITNPEEPQLPVLEEALSRANQNILNIQLYKIEIEKIEDSANLTLSNLQDS